MPEEKKHWFSFVQSNNHDDSFPNHVKYICNTLNDEEPKAKLGWVDWWNSRKIGVCFKRFSRQSDILDELKMLNWAETEKCRLHLYRADQILKQQNRYKTCLVCDILLLRLLLQIADSVTQYFHWKHILMMLTANHFNLPCYLLAAELYGNQM